MLRRTTGLSLLVFFFSALQDASASGIIRRLLAICSVCGRGGFARVVRFPAHTPPARRGECCSGARTGPVHAANRRDSNQAKRTKAEQAVRRQRRQSKPSTQYKSTALRVGATFTVGCARPAAPITQRIHPRSSGGQEFGECSRSCVGRSCRVAPAIPRPPAPNSTSFKGSAVGRHPCWEITLGLTLLRTGMLR